MKPTSIKQRLLSQLYKKIKAAGEEGIASTQLADSIQSTASAVTDMVWILIGRGLVQRIQGHKFRAQD